MPRKLNAEDRLLQALATVQFGSKYNFQPFFSPRAKSLDASLNWTSRIMDRLLAEGRIARIPHYGRGTTYRHNTFYRLTGKGFRSLERKYKYIEPKSIDMLSHQSALIDSLLGIYFAFPDYEMTVDYGRKFGQYSPDAFITLKDFIRPNYYFYFILELERTRTDKAIIDEKIKKIERVFNPPNKFKEYGISPETHFLFVLTKEYYDVFTRPIEYSDKPEFMKIMDKEFEKSIKVFSDYNLKCFYRFAKLHDFKNFGQPIWHKMNNTKVSLFN